MSIRSRRQRWQNNAAAYAPQPTGAAYTAQGVAFHNSPYLSGTSSTDFTGVIDGNTFLMSFWFNILGNDSNYQILFEQDGGGGHGVQVYRSNTNFWVIFAANAAASNICSVASSLTFTSSTNTGWHHLLCAYTPGTLPRLYVDDVDDAISGVDTGGTADYTPGTTHYFGARGGAIPLNADVADVYLALNQYLDISNVTNRRKFIDAGGAPVNLGATGSTPTGTAPTLYLSGAVASWHVNKGTGGNLFTVQNGPLAAAATNPS